MKKLFLFLILFLIPSLVLAVPVSYYGNIVEYSGDWAIGHSLRAVSDTSITEKTIYQEQFLLNHLANRGEIVTFYFDGNDIITYTQPLPGSIVNLGDVAIGNIAPTAPTIDVKPNVAYTTNDLVCDITEESSDAEEDTISYTYKWYKNNVLQSSLTTNTVSLSNTISLSNTAKGEVWKCIVTPSDGKTHSDGTIYGPSASDSVKILNSPPRINSFEPTNTKPTVAEGDTLSFSVEALDDDGSLTYSWKLDGTEVSTIDSHDYTLLYTDAGTHTMVVTVSDGELSKTKSWKITVINENQDPVLNPIGAQTLTEDKSFTYDVDALENDADDILKFYDNTTLFSIDRSTGLISFTPTQADVGTHDVKILVEDGKGGSDSETVIFTINDMNDAPVLETIGTQTAIQGMPFTYDVDATDEDGDSLTYSLTTSPNGMTIDSETGTISWIPSAIQTESYDVVVSVDDDNEGTDTESFSIIVTDVNYAPIIESYDPPSASVSITEEEESQTFTISASDPDGGTPSVKWYKNNVIIDGETSDSYTFVGDYTSAGTYTIKAEISDGEFIRSNTWILTVTDTNRAPTLTVPPTATCTEDFPCSISVDASDDDTDNTLVYSENTAMFRIGLLTGAVSFTPTQSDVGTHNIQFRVADGTTAVTKTTTLTITDTPDAPILERIGSRTLEEGNSYTIPITATDEDPEDTLTYSLTNEPGGMTIDSSEGTISWAPTFQDSGIYSVLVAVTDDSSRSDSEEVTFTVLNQNQAPIINKTESTPAQYVIMKEDNSTTFIVNASDPDGTELTTSWYKDDVLLEDEISESYTFQGNFSDEGTNAGVYAIKVEVSDGMATDSYTWTLNVTRTRDADEDNIPDYRDNCRLVYNPSQVDSDDNGVGDACQGNVDGDDVEDENDFVLGDEDNIETNVENMDLTIGGSSNLNQIINETQNVNLTETNYDETTGEASTVPVVEFEFNFTSNSNLDLGNLSVKKQTGNQTGSMIIAGIDLTAQGRTKTVYVDRLAGEDYVCVKDAEIASITELPSSDCTGTGEIAVPCSVGGSTSGDYTCTIIDNKFKVEGLSHSGVTESSYSPSPPEDTGGGGGGGGAGGGGGGGGGGGLPFTCNMDWECSDWSDCVDSVQTRTCNFVKVPQHASGTRCPEESNPPAISRECEIPEEVPTEAAEEEVLPTEEVAPAVEPPAAPGALARITGAVGATIGKLFATEDRSLLLDFFIIVTTIVVGGLFMFSQFYGGMPGADHFTRASNFHKRAENAYKKGKREKSEKLHEKAQKIREEGEKIIFRGT